MTKRDNWASPSPTRTTFLVGDIHGCAAELEHLMQLVEAEFDYAISGDPALVFVGDYIDRGPDSAVVLEFLHGAQTEAPDLITCLLGNHERMMLDFLDDPTGPAKRWLRHGGLETVASMGLRAQVTSEGGDAAALVDLAFDIRAALGADRIAWLQALPLSWNSGTLWAVHAAADPALPMPAQEANTLLWGTSSFGRIDRTDAQWVAYGHVPVEDPKAERGRVPLDTGAVYGGPLTAARIDPDGLVRFIQTR
ncbi:metallophosphoesterase [Roseibacterium elongatum DSM 19469]|uniref:Metallophosphoesterase n=1 Tax=Roseicyclus elongatus DSM 19469 TaxID=1294273 RepID=W8S4L9_9RHOB|nr:metallophosphoesterase [Roseibacterium elongatum]AHM03756.1 metallophosphoesterase [Roseibacterium elongatum DSM 19469]